MPTHVLIRVPPPPQSETDTPRARRPRLIHKNDRDDAFQHENQQISEDGAAAAAQPRSPITKTPIAGVVGFRYSVRHTSSNRSLQQHVSRDDIRGSPRLQGYLFMLVASIVMLVSAVRFYIDGDDKDSVQVVRRERGLEEDDENNDNLFTHTFGSRVLTWKLDGAVVVSAAAVGISVFVLVVHFDSVLLPQFWKIVFRDGSYWELALLIGLLLFWMGALHICTSAFSVGEVAPNVYFTTWIAFASASVNIGMWRRGADLPLLIDMVRNDKRETVYGWCTVLVFSLVTACSILELYANRDELEILLEGVVQQVPQREWNKALGTSFSAVGVSLLNAVCVHYLSDKPLRIRLCRGWILNLDWRQVEGFCVVSVLGLFSWFIYEYTGVNSALSGPSNPYFGSWGVWFSSVLTFGTWMRENKHIAFILRNSEDDTTETES